MAADDDVAPVMTMPASSANFQTANSLEPTLSSRRRRKKSAEYEPVRTADSASSLYLAPPYLSHLCHMLMAANQPSCLRPRYRAWVFVPRVVFKVAEDSVDVN